MEIYQTHVDVLSAAILSRNLTAFLKRVQIPHTIKISDEVRLIDNIDDMAMIFYTSVRTFKQQGVTDYARIATSAKYVSETEITGTHTTHLIRNGYRLVPPYQNALRLRLIDDRWIETDAATALINKQWPIMMPEVANEPAPLTLPDQRRLSVTAPNLLSNPAALTEEPLSEAMQIYQDLLDKIGAAYFANDFEYFKSVIHVPHRFVTFDDEFIIPDVAALRRSFSSFRLSLQARGVTDFLRTCVAADLRDDKMIDGTHITHLRRNGVWVCEPYPVRSLLKQHDTGWKVHESENAVEEDTVAVLAFKTGAVDPDIDP